MAGHCPLCQEGRGQGPPGIDDRANRSPPWPSQCFANTAVGPSLPSVSCPHHWPLPQMNPSGTQAGAKPRAPVIQGTGAVRSLKVGGSPLHRLQAPSTLPALTSKRSPIAVAHRAPRSRTRRESSTTTLVDGILNFLFCRLFFFWRDFFRPYLLSLELASSHSFF